MLSGAIKKYSGISFILAHAGGFVPFIAYRIMLAMLRDSNRRIQAAKLLAPDHLVPSYLAVLKKFYYDIALSSTPAALPSLLEVADPGHITYGSDYPVAPARAVGLMNHY